jgi:cytochrome o ubiquinol oxidase subunit 3
MTTEAAKGLPQAGQSEAPGRGRGGPADRRIVVGYGFWIFILSDIIMFSALFATYAVLSNRTAGGPAGKQLFDLTNVAIETGCLLFSSFTCGFVTVAAEHREKLNTYIFSAITFALGATFLGLELTEFTGMIAQGAGPDRSAFLSAFFTLVGMHGLHVTVGLLWLVIMMVQIATRGFQSTTLIRLHCFSLFWHALDIIWIALFTVVYLFGVL